jgi:hypothetical protein
VDLISLCIGECVFNTWYLCVKCTNLWMNKFYTIFTINLSYVKFLMQCEKKTWTLQLNTTRGGSKGNESQI